MTKRGGFVGGDDEGAIRFVPSPGFDVRKAAPHFVALMEDMGQHLIIDLPSVDLEFEPGCTARQIIDGYTQALKSQIAATPPSNSNDGSGRGR